MRLKAILCITLLWVSIFSFAQKNAIKGLPVYWGPPFYSSGFVASLSLGYEFQISERSSVDLNVFSLLENFYSGEGSTIMYGFAPSYRYYFREPSIRFNVFLSPYFMYLWMYDSGTHTDAKGYLLSAGVSSGIRYFFSKKNKWFIDAGVGLTYGKYTYTYYQKVIPLDDEGGGYTLDYTIPDPKWICIPRPILQIGCKF